MRRKEREPPQIQSLDTDRDNFREEDFEAKSKSRFGKTLQNEDRNKNLNEDVIFFNFISHENNLY